jgi:type VI secretion system protein ImpG
MVVARPGQRPAPGTRSWPETRFGGSASKTSRRCCPTRPPRFRGTGCCTSIFRFSPTLSVRGIGRDWGRRRARCAESRTGSAHPAQPCRSGARKYVVAADHFALFCAPAINLFPKRADRIHLSDQVAEHHLVPDRTRPMDFEVHQVGWSDRHRPRRRRTGFPAVLCQPRSD